MRRNLVRLGLGQVVAMLTFVNIAAATSSATEGDAERLSARFRDAARRVLPSVVTVRALGVPSPIAGVEPRDADGSGVIIDAEAGIILTNDHVVRDAPRVVVTLNDGRERTAVRVRHDPRSDLAIVKIAAPGLTAARWGDSEALDLGDWVLAIGQPFGLAGTVTAGIVSGKSRGLGETPYEDLVQTDAAINPGNSGGPLVNLAGEVVGINTAIKTQGGGYEGVGFAVPAARARRIADDLARFGQVKRASIGVLIGRLDPQRMEQIARPGAVPITGVAPLSPAADADLRPGDVILTVNGAAAQGVGMLQSRIESAPVGIALRLTILRDGKTLEASVRPVSQDRDEAAVPVPPVASAAEAPPANGDPRPPAADILDARTPTRFPSLGMRLSEPTADLSRRFGSEANPKGLFVRGLEPGGPADRAGIELGMLVTDVAGKRVVSLADVREALADRPAARDLVLRVVKGQKAEFRILLDLNPTGHDAESRR